MTKNPLINACAASCYVSGVAFLMFYGSAVFASVEGVIIPIGVLSLLVFSAATMGFIFLYQPLQLLVEGQQKDGVMLFLKTLFFFGAIAALMFLLVFFAGDASSATP